MVVSLSGCAAGSDEPTQPPSTEVNGSLVDSSDELAAELFAEEPCPTVEGPADMYQRPFAVEHVRCEEQSVAVFVYGDDGDGRHYELEQTELGTSAGARAAVVGPNWMVTGPRDRLEAVAARFGGTVFTSQSSAIAASPGAAQEDPYPGCHITYTAAVAEYMRSGVDVVVQVEMVLPGIYALFQQEVAALLPTLPSFASDDASAVVRDLDGIAPQLRQACRELFPRS